MKINFTISNIEYLTCTHWHWVKLMFGQQQSTQNYPEKVFSWKIHFGDSFLRLSVPPRNKYTPASQAHTQHGQVLLFLVLFMDLIAFRIELFGRFIPSSKYRIMWWECLKSLMLLTCCQCAWKQLQKELCNKFNDSPNVTAKKKKTNSPLILMVCWF